MKNPLESVGATLFHCHHSFVRPEYYIKISHYELYGKMYGFLLLLLFFFSAKNLVHKVIFIEWLRWKLRIFIQTVYVIYVVSIRFLLWMYLYFCEKLCYIHVVIASNSVEEWRRHLAIFICAYKIFPHRTTFIPWIWCSLHMFAR